MNGNVCEIFVWVFENDDEFVDFIGGLGGFSFFNDSRSRKLGMIFNNMGNFMFDFDCIVF